MTLKHAIWRLKVVSINYFPFSDDFCFNTFLCNEMCIIACLWHTWSVLSDPTKASHRESSSQNHTRNLIYDLVFFQFHIRQMILSLFGILKCLWTSTKASSFRNWNSFRPRMTIAQPNILQVINQLIHHISARYLASQLGMYCFCCWQKRNELGTRPHAELLSTAHCFCSPLELTWSSAVMRNFSRFSCRRRLQQSYNFSILVTAPVW